MAFKIGYIDLDGKGGVIDDCTVSGRLYGIPFIVTDATAIDNLRTIFIESNRVRETPKMKGATISDISPFKINVIYLDITNTYTGWAIYTGEVTESVLSDTVSRFEMEVMALTENDIKTMAMSYECENYAVAGAAVQDFDCSGYYLQRYVPTSSDVKVMDINALNLKDGDYRFVLHAKAKATTEFKLICGAWSGTWVSVETDDVWTELPLGTPTLSSASTGCEIHVRDTSATDSADMDILQICAENYTGQYRIRADYGCAG